MPRNPAICWRSKGTKPGTTTVPTVMAAPVKYTAPRVSSARAAQLSPARLLYFILLNEFAPLEDSEDQDDSNYHGFSTNDSIKDISGGKLNSRNAGRDKVERRDEKETERGQEE
ncbi:hypothetical protein BDD12DRAFT_904671 [Trichophaea hybrida]|nr:hypothetical protein BDD12DRAFT_904671 [Trichophaea hybrida]